MSLQKRLQSFLKNLASKLVLYILRLGLFLICFQIYKAVAKGKDINLDCHKPYSSTLFKTTESILNSCPEVKKIYEANKTFKLGIGYAGEYLGNPSSAFGHAFLILIDSDSFPLSQTISYLADVKPNQSLFSLIRNGLMGGYTGRYKSVPLYRLEHLYSGIESRDILIYEFKKELYDISKVIFFLIENEKEESAYLFLSNNCATGLNRIIDAVIKSESKSKIKEIIDYPGYIFKKHASILTLYKKYDSPEKIVFANSQKIEKQRLDLIKSNIERNRENTPSDTFEAHYLDAIYKYLSFKANSVQDNRSLLLSTFSNLPLNETPHINKKLPTHEFQKISIGVLKTKKSNFINISYRPGFIDEFQYSLKDAKKSTLELFKFNFLVNNENQLLDNLELLNVEENTNFQWPTFRKSWRLNLGYNSNYITTKSGYKNINLSYLAGLGKFNDYFGVSLKGGPSIKYFFKSK